jgi:hypothetical protein
LRIGDTSAFLAFGLEGFGASGGCDCGFGVVVVAFMFIPLFVRYEHYHRLHLCRCGTLGYWTCPYMP